MIGKISIAIISNLFFSEASAHVLPITQHIFHLHSNVVRHPSSSYCTERTYQKMGKESGKGKGEAKGGKDDKGKDAKGGDKGGKGGKGK